MRRESAITAIRQILQKHGIREAYLFGSFARKEKGYRDIDIAITPPKGFSLLDMAGVLVELEDGTGKKVDLVSLRSISPRLRPHIRNDLTAIV